MSCRVVNRYTMQTLTVRGLVYAVLISDEIDLKARINTKLMTVTLQ